MTEYAKPEIWWTMVIFITVVMLLVFRRLPSIEGFSKFVALADSKGGNILILLFMTFISLVWSIRFGYYSIHAVQRAIAAGQAPPSDTTIQVMMTWLTGSVSSGFMGALIKTMTGEHPSPETQVPTSVQIVQKPTGGPNDTNTTQG